MTRRFPSVVLGILALAWLLLPLTPARAESSSEAFDAAQRLYDGGQWKEALAAFQKFQTNFIFSAVSPRAAYLEGWCRYNMNQYPDALAKFDQVIALANKGSPIAKEDAPAAFLKKAECYRELKDLDKAMEIYVEFQKKYSDSPLLPQAALGQAWVLYKKKEYEKAVTLAGLVKQRFTDNITARLDSLFLLGQIYTEQEKFEDARKTYEEIKSMRYNPRATEALFLAAESMFDSGDKLMKEGKNDLGRQRIEDAIGYYQRVQSKASLLATIDNQVKQLQDLIPKQRDRKVSIQAGIDNLRQLKASLANQGDLRPAALFRIANCYQTIGKANEAIVVYNHFLRLYPKDPLAPQAQFTLIQSLTLAGRPDAAKKATEDLDKMFPELKGKDIALYAKFMGAKAEFDTAQYKNSIEAFTKFIAESKDAKLNETAEFYIAVAYLALEQYDIAKKSLATFIEKYPQSELAVDAQFRLGRTNYELYGKAQEPEAKKTALAEAGKYYEMVKASGKKELQADVTFQLGYLYSYLGEFDPTAYPKAAAAFAEYAKNWPQNEQAPEAQYQAARNRYAAKDEPGTLAAYQELIQKFPDSKLAPYAAYETGLVHLSAKQSDKMIEAFKLYIQKYPTHDKVGSAYFAIGQDFENRKKFEEALTEYKGLVTFAANTKGANEDLINAAIASELQIAKILEGIKKIPEAIQSLQDFLKKFSSTPAAARAAVAQIAGIYSRAKQYDEAHAKLDGLVQEYIQLAEVRVAAQTSMIELALAQGNKQKAYESALKLLADPAKDSLPAASYLAIGNALVQNERWQEARDSYERMTTLYADDQRATPLGLVGLGNAELKLNHIDQAEAAYGGVLTKFKEHPATLDATLGVGKVYEARGDVAKAVPMYDTVLRSGRGAIAVEASFRLGMLAFNKQPQPDYKAALSFYARLMLESGPMAEEALFRSAICHEKLAPAEPNPDKRAALIELARRTFKAYLMRYPEGKFAVEAKQHLDALPAPAPAQ